MIEVALGNGAVHRDALILVAVGRRETGSDHKVGSDKSFGERIFANRQGLPGRCMQSTLFHPIRLATHWFQLCDSALYKSI